MPAKVEDLTTPVLIREADEVARVLDVIASPRQAAIIRELTMRLAGGRRRVIPYLEPAAATVSISPIAKQVPAQTTFGPVSDGKRWCEQCDRRVNDQTASACRSTFCSLKLRA